jgi:UTP--glucose-1-phosphate uridylyltransferase
MKGSFFVTRQPVKKAVFLVAGLGTRFLPATKAIPKELLPIIDKPAIQYAVEEAIDAGITELIFITGRTKRAIEDHFDANPELERALHDAGKHEVLDTVRRIVPENVSCIFLRQARPLGTGHAVKCALPVIGSDPVALFLPDDVFLGGDGIQSLIAAYNDTGKSVLGTVEVDNEHVSNYGIIRPGDEPGSVIGMVEKPKLSAAPSREASIGRYILDPGVYDLLEDLQPSIGGELVLTDALNARAEAGGVVSVRLPGKRFDCGSKAGYLEAIVEFALEHPTHKERFRAFLNEKVKSIASVR